MSWGRVYLGLLVEHPGKCVLNRRSSDSPLDVVQELSIFLRYPKEGLD